MTERPADFLPFARPSITEREKEAVLGVLDSGWLTTGAVSKTFEERFAEMVGARHAIALNSATAALHLALEAMGVGPDDEVIVPTWTFAASAEVVAYRGARPVLVDVDAATLNATPETITAAVTPRTKAVIVVHVAGRPIEIERTVALLEPRGIGVVEDAAHAFPSRVGGPDGRYAGTFGTVGAYSFYATKTITTGEGGMLVTDDAAIADRARLMSLHGISRTRLEPLRGERLVVLRDRGCRLQIQHDRHRRRARARPARPGRRSSSRRAASSPAGTRPACASPRSRT